MPLLFQNQDLLSLMQQFHTLTGMRIVLFDEAYREIFAYPRECVPFCAHMRKTPAFYQKCCVSDKNSFEICQKTRSFTMYKCHAGLIECTAPILQKNTIIGYIMFGQISDRTDKAEFLSALSSRYPGEEQKIRKIKFRSTAQLIAASKILEACISYILEKEMVRPSRVLLFSRVEEYIDAHLGEALNIDALCRAFSVSRTHLYDVMRPYMRGGIAGYIKEKRLSKAKELLKTTDLSVSEISERVGFADYNYFIRNFKKRFGLSAKKYQKTYYE